MDSLGTVFSLVCTAISFGSSVYSYSQDKEAITNELQSLQDIISRLIEQTTSPPSTDDPSSGGVQPGAAARSKKHAHLPVLDELGKKGGLLDQFALTLLRYNKIMKKHKLAGALLWKWEKKDIKTDVLDKSERLKSSLNTVLAIATQCTLYARKFKELRKALELEQERTAVEESQWLWSFLLKVLKSTKVEISYDTNKATKALVRSATQKEILEALDWISPPSGNFDSDKYRSLLRSKTEGTGSWFVEAESFRKWLHNNETPSCLVCLGDPGTGKSFLAATAIQHIKTSRTEPRVVAYIFCDYKSNNDTQVVDHLAALLRQIASQDVNADMAEALLRLHAENRHRREEVTKEQIQQALEETIAKVQRVYIIIDALDECRHDIRRDLLDSIAELARSGKHGSTLRLMATSQPSPTLVSCFEKRFHTAESVVRVKITAHSSDVRAYVKRSLQNQNRFRSDQDFCKKIEDTVVEAVQGLFLLAPLILASLLDGTNSKKEVKHALATMLTPSKDLASAMERYSAAYLKTMDRIDSQSEAKKNLAKKTLAWVIWSKRVLTPQELRYALAIDKGEKEFDEEGLLSLEDIVSACKGLVVIDLDNDTVRLSHHSVHEFFTGPQGHLERWNPRSKLYVASICLTVLNFESYDEAAKSWGASNPDEETTDFTETVLQMFQELPFLRYVAFFWPQHLREVCDKTLIKSEDCNETLIEPAIAFLESGARFRFLFHKMWYEFDESVPLVDLGTLWADEKQAPLMSCAHLGVAWLYEAMLKRIEPAGRLSYLNMVDRSGFTTLHRAVHGNHVALVGFLLEQKGIDVTRGSGRLTPLGAACAIGYQEVVAALLKHPDLNATSPVCLPSRPWMSVELPIHVATRKQHLGVVRLLMEDPKSKEDLVVNARTSGGDTPLHIACKQRNEEMVSYLLGRQGIRVNDETTDGETPLLLAATEGNVPILRMLLQRKDIDIKRRMPTGATPLHQAPRSILTGLEATKFMVELGIFDIEATDNFGDTPLLVAVRKVRFGELGIVEYLIHHAGANLHALTNKGESLLHVAVESGRLGTVEYLVETHGFDIAAEDKAGRTPIQAALGPEGSHHLDVDVFDYLIDKHLEGSHLEINGQCEFVRDRGYGEYSIARYKGRLRLAKVHAKCGVCARITEILRVRGFYFDEDHALVEKARSSRPSDWCINPRKGGAEESDGSTAQS